VSKKAKEELIQPEHTTLPPTTTAQQDLITAGQRTINLLWEITQSRLALIIVITFNLVLMGIVTWALISLIQVGQVGDIDTYQAVIVVLLAALGQLYGLTNLVVGFYFGRTNHQRTGGVGGEDVDRSR